MSSMDNLESWTLHCKVENENGSNSFQSESYIKEEIMIPDMTEYINDEASSTVNRNLQSDQISFQRCIKNESTLIYKEEIYNQYDSNFDVEMSVNVDEKNDQLFVQADRSKYFPENEGPNHTETANFDNNTIRIDQCSIKIEVDEASDEEFVLPDVTDYSDMHVEKYETYTRIRTREVTKLEVNPKDKDKETASPKAFKKKTGKLNTVVGVCPKCSRKEEKVLRRNRRIKCTYCKELLRYECLMCGQLMPSVSAVYYHIKKKCGQQTIYRCEQCSYQGNSEHLLRCHITRQHGSKLECPTCGKKFTKKNIGRHKTMCGINMQYFKCKLCSFSTKYKCNVANHIRRTHTLFEPQQHAGIIKTIIEEGEKIKDYKKFMQLCCIKCGESHESMDYNKDRHCQKCGGVTTLQCAKCAKRFPNLRKLCAHLGYKCAATNQFQCAECDYTTTLKSTLAVHISHKHTIVTPENYEKCSKCDRQYKHRYDRIEHEKRCVKLPTLKCAHCGFMTLYFSTIARHLLLKHKAQARCNINGKIYRRED